MACFPPVRPWVVPGPSGFQLLEAPTVLFQNSRASPLLHFDATLSVLLSRLPQHPAFHVDHDPPNVVPRVSFSALQHFRIQEPFFSLLGSLEAAWERCPTPMKSHPRVWLPSR